MPPTDRPSPLLYRAQKIADDILFPAAQDVDRSGRVPASHLATMAEAGLFGLAGPTATGEQAPIATEVRRTLAAIAGGCGATFFVWAQHHGVVARLRSSPNRALAERWLKPLCSGSSIAGVAFAHLRRGGPPAIVATPIDGGWSFSGVAPWATSWGIAEQFAVAAETPNGQAVWALIPGRDSIDDGFATEPLALPVLHATGTVVLRFDDYRVDDIQIIAIEDANQWRKSDRIRAAQGQTGVLGVAHRAVRELAELGDQAATEAANSLLERLDRLWRDDDQFTNALPTTDDDIASASQHRARCLALGRGATTAFLAATGGRGMDLAHPAQRLAREADFYVIQAQTADGRQAVLKSMLD